MGRGIEGCGVTKFTIEQIKWLSKNGFEYVVYASKDKSWTRKNAHDVSNVIQIKFAKKDETQKMINACNECDVVIINSLPSVGHTEECINEFKRALIEIKKPIVLVQHDHNARSIRRNAAIDESIKRADLIFGHSSTSDFAKIVHQTTNEIDMFSMFDAKSKSVINFQPGMDFDELRKKYWLDIKDTNAYHHKWIGRTASWKGHDQFFKFHGEYLKPNGHISTLEGIERSPGWLGFKEMFEFNDSTGDNINEKELKTNELAYVFGPFINDEMLKRMAKVAYGYQLSLLDERFIERSIEYTHCELAAVGVIPVFRKAYGERCTHRLYGEKLVNCKNTGTIWLDDNNMQDSYDIIEKLSKDEVLRDEYRNMAFEFYKSHQDSNYTFSEMMDKILENVNEIV